jgi:hypothetical protein
VWCFVSAAHCTNDAGRTTLRFYVIEKRDVKENITQSKQKLHQAVANIKGGR